MMLDVQGLKNATENALYDYKIMKAFVDSLDSLPSASSSAPKLSPTGHKNDPVPRDAMTLANSHKYRWVQLIEKERNGFSRLETALLDQVYLSCDGKPDRKKGNKRIEQFYKTHTLTHSAYYRTRDKILERITFEALKEGLL
jgi:hypothetical protein